MNCRLSETLIGFRQLQRADGIPRRNRNPTPSPSKLFYVVARRDFRRCRIVPQLLRQGIWNFRRIALASLTPNSLRHFLRQFATVFDEVHPALV